MLFTEKLLNVQPELSHTALFTYHSVHLAHCRCPDPSVFVYLWLQPEHPGQRPELNTHKRIGTYSDRTVQKKDKDILKNDGLTFSYFMFLWFKSSCKLSIIEGKAKFSSHLGWKNNSKVHKFHLNEPHRERKPLAGSRVLASVTFKWHIVWSDVIFDRGRCHGEPQGTLAVTLKLKV